MKSDVLSRAVYLADMLGYAFLATADDHGWPHMTAAGRLALTPQDHLLVLRWYCPTTTANLRANQRVSVVVWDPARDAGYQIVAQAQEVKDVGLLSAEVPDVPADVMVEKQLLLHVDRVVEFRRGPHSDAGR